MYVETLPQISLKDFFCTAFQMGPAMEKQDKIDEQLRKTRAAINKKLMK